MLTRSRPFSRLVLSPALLGSALCASSAGAAAPDPSSPPPLATASAEHDIAAATPAAATAASGAVTSLPSLTGSIGLFHSSTAVVGPVHQLRLGLHGELFSASGFLINADSNHRLAGSFAAGYTLRRDVEVFGALLSSSNRNQRTRAPNDRDPELIRTFGDLVLGGKWILPLSPAATFGVELGLKFLSGVSDLAFSPSSTSWWLGPLFTYDLRRHDVRFPVRLHASSSFYADNSSNLHDLSDVTRNTKEVAMFAYGMAPSRLRLALAAEIDLERLVPRVPINAFLEYQLAYVTADADLDFADFMKPNCDPSGQTGMPCVENRDMQWLTLGARAAVYRGVTVDLGIDLRIRSAGFPYGPPLPPWNLMFGVSYPLNLEALTRTVVVTRTIEKAAPPTEGHVTGFVRDARSGVPVSGAVVAVVGRVRARAAVDPDGGFATPGLPAGPVALEIAAAGFETAKMNADVVAGGDTDVTVALVPELSTASATVKLTGRVTDEAGNGIEASLKFAGDQISETRSETSGAYSWMLPPGSYQVRVDGQGLVPQELQLTLAPGQDRQLDFVLASPVNDPNVVLVEDAIKLLKPIRFVGATATLAPTSLKLLDGVADLLKGHAEIKRVDIIAHWDNGLRKEEAGALTQRQAEAVRAYLVNRGIAEGRLVPVGAGLTRPLVPNLSPANRARNRRVELHLP